MSASITVSGADVTFVATAAEDAVAEREVTQADSDTAVTYTFEVERRSLILRVGTATGEQDIVADAVFAPGVHVVSFAPGVSTYYINFRLTGEGTAVLADFAKAAAGDLSIATPWAGDVLRSLRHEQSLNTQWWCNIGFETRALERRGATSWSLRLYRPENGPFNSTNLSAVQMTPSARTGTVTITASRPVFQSGDVGALIRLTHPGQFETETFTAAEQVTDPIRVQGVERERIFNYSIEVTTSGTVVLERSIGTEANFVTYQTFSTTTSGQIDDDLDNQLIFYRFRCTATGGSVAVTLTYGAGVTDGVGRIVSVTADNAASVDVIEPFGKTTATTLWATGAWSGRLGYPTSVALHDGRLFFARRNAYYGSAPDDFEDFRAGPDDGAAVGRTFPGRMSSARWLASTSTLVAGLSGQEAAIMSNAFEERIVPVNVRSKVFSDRGSADADPANINGAIAFVSRSLQRLLLFATSEGRFATTDLTRLNHQIAGLTGFREISVQFEPEPRIWCVRNDGQIAVLSFDPEEQVFAWWRIVHDGAVESVACVPGTPEDDVYFVVRRTIGGVEKRYVEKLAPEAWASSSEAWRLHSALSYSGEATTTLTGLSHLEGKAVHVWGNGCQQGPYTVASGAIALAEPVTYAIVGLQYEGRYRSPRLAWGGQMGTALTRDKRVTDLGMIVENTPGGCLAWGRSFTSLERLQDRQVGDAYDNPISLWTDDLKARAYEGETAPDPRIHIVMDRAGPAKVLAIVPTLHTNE